MLGRRGTQRAVSLPRFVAVAVSAVLALLGGAATATATRPDEQPADPPSDQSALQRTAANAAEHPVVTTAVHLHPDDLGHAAAPALADPPRPTAPATAGSAADRALSAVDVGSVSTQRNRAPPAADPLTS